MIYHIIFNASMSVVSIDKLRNVCQRATIIKSTEINNDPLRLSKVYKDTSHRKLSSDLQIEREVKNTYRTTFLDLKYLFIQRVAKQIA